MKKINLTFILILFLSLAMYSCGDKKKDYLVDIKTSYGTMRVLLYNETPLHKKNFLRLTKEGKFDSTIFHRVINDFMIQGGDIFRGKPEQETEADRIPAEIVKGFYHTKGSLAAARQGDGVNPKRMSSSCQFYIVDGMPWEMLSTNMRLLNEKISEMVQQPEYADLLKQFQELAMNRDTKGMNLLALEQRKLIEEKYGVDLSFDPKTKNNEAYKKMGGSPHLDEEYTVFGRVVEGMDVIDKIAEVKTGAGDIPVKDIIMTMEVVEMKKKEVTSKYGYEYPKN